MFSNILKDISLSFQPIVDLSTGRVERYESLSRFDYFSPSDVASNISYIESSGFAIEFDRRILWFIKDLLKTPGFFHNKQININLTGQSISDPSFYLWLNKFMSKLDNKHFLGIEITETLPITDIDVGQNVIDLLNAWGVKVYLDDIPSGHMSNDIVSSLKNYHGIKIDGQVVSKWGVDESSMNITNNILELSRERNICVTAEYIDDTSKVLYAQDMGIHHGQGFILGQPLPIPEHPKTITNRFHSLLDKNH